MVDINDYMACTNPLHYDIDKDISVEMVTDNKNNCFVSIYNDRTDKSVAVQTSKDKLLGLADFLIKNLGNK
jgi:Rod binding domain-containing protein